MNPYLSLEIAAIAAAISLISALSALRIDSLRKQSWARSVAKGCYAKLSDQQIRAIARKIKPDDRDTDIVWYISESECRG